MKRKLTSISSSAYCRNDAQARALEQSAHAAFDALEQAVRQLFGVSGSAPLAPAHANALMSIWSVVHGFANLALSGQFDHLRPAATAKTCCARCWRRCSSSN